MKFASKSPTLRNILSIESKTQGSTRPAFNKQRRTQVDEAKVRRSSNPRLAYQIQEPRLKIKHEHEPRVGGSHSKETLELRELLKLLLMAKTSSNGFTT